MTYYDLNTNEQSVHTVFWYSMTY